MKVKLPQKTHVELVDETRDIITFTSTSSTKANLHSSTAKAIAKATGVNEDVMKLDKLRARIQTCSPCPINLQKEYDTTMAKLHTQLLTAIRQKLDRMHLIE